MHIEINFHNSRLLPFLRHDPYFSNRELKVHINRKQNEAFLPQ
jgi:hypothetical protein